MGNLIFAIYTGNVRGRRADMSNEREHDIVDLVGSPQGLPITLGGATPTSAEVAVVAASVAPPRDAISSSASAVIFSVITNCGIDVPSPSSKCAASVDAASVTLPPIAVDVSSPATSVKLSASASSPIPLGADND
ncbi:hypothetical protein HJC23_011573 [Cyclotella cryptica]|uniref:Uncharacterized protein n=1 Tax=Cyclotella cryptica TaxID=29204 RepID=A0ABD3QXY5_9STRA